MKTISFRKCCSGVAVCLLLSIAPYSNAVEVSDTPVFTDDYVLSNTYISPEGIRLDGSDGVTVHSGEIELSSLESASMGGMYENVSHTYRFGSSFASTVEQRQLFYTGTAYASGKKDFYQDLKMKRVYEVCFKYTRDGKDVVRWQCSQSSLGPSYTPGKKVSWTVRDTMNPIASKTIFRYSYKTSS